MKVIIESMNGETQEFIGKNAFVFMECEEEPDDGIDAVYGISGEIHVTKFHRVLAKSLARNVFSLTKRGQITKAQATLLLADIHDAYEKAVEEVLDEIADTATPEEMAEIKEIEAEMEGLLKQVDPEAHAKYEEEKKFTS